ncbi:S8 family serine peptidase [Actinosynnema pretiosum]|uniref:Peptidase S8 n=1 Tax=Actinosynnema pretiosum TaxID=42197 RepID=A0A290Z2L6_9PSEU|nr:S8 family serine peptidase [Actinosynnema pretiosum]ATE53193.1 peptidase S8 [Actinosynnema pretiosum]
MEREARRGARHRSRTAGGRATGVASADRRGGPPVGPGAGERTEVTLITGDRVVLRGGGLGEVVAGPGRERQVFRTSVAGARLHVVPQDAVPALASGKLDPRLFDVTGLVDAGYDDARRDSVPVVVTRDGGGRTSALEVGRELPLVGAVAARAPKSGAAFPQLLADPGVRKVWLDGVMRPSLDRSAGQIGAPAAWAAGHTGAGVRVAVLDTGVDDGHPEPAGRAVARANFTDSAEHVDDVGHGTHVAATIASAGGTYRGVAPDAELLDGKVCALDGCAESWILAGAQWAVDRGAAVVNLSLGGADTPGLDPVEEAVESLSDRALFVVAAGNSGRPGTIGSPGSADSALTVGAVDRQDGLAPFSSRGPRLGDSAVKPDVTAPGTDVVAARSRHGTEGTPVDEGHVSMSGTSMATPHVAGAAALLKQRHPDWSGRRIKAALVASATPNPALTPHQQGSGRVDVARALALEVSAEPSSLALGVRERPHDDDEPVTGDLVHRNDSDAPVALDLAVDAVGPDGRPTTGVLTVAPAALTVPAGGTATARVTGDTRPDVPDGAHSGLVTASSGGGVLVRTPVSVERAQERCSLTVRHVGRDGGPAEESDTAVIDLDQPSPRYSVGAESTATLPPGEYGVWSSVASGGGGALLTRPALVLDRDTTITVDAREAEPLRVTPPDPEAEPLVGGYTINQVHEGRTTSYTYLFPGGFPEELWVGRNGGELPAGQQSRSVGAQSAGGDGSFYRFGWEEPGVGAGFVREPAAGELATVRTTVGPAPEGQRASHAGNPVFGDGSGWGASSEVAAPGVVVDHVNTEPGWRWTYTQNTADFAWSAGQSSGDERYRAGREHRRSTNGPVFGPVLADWSTPPLVREGGQLRFSLSLFGDRAGNLGASDTASARTALERNGKPVGESAWPGSGQFTLEPGAADYRVSTEVVRTGGASDFSTRLSGAWTFRAGAGTGRAELPLTLVRFTPALDRDGAARAGFSLLPLEFQRAGGASGLRSLTVEASYDDGASWAKVPMLLGSALLDLPRAGEFTSLRVKGVDGAGNGFEQTAIRAYKIKH